MPPNTTSQLGFNFLFFENFQKKKYFPWPSQVIPIW